MFPNFFRFQGRRPLFINFLQLEPNPLIAKQTYTSRYKKLGPDSLKAGGKPSTWFPPGGLVEPNNCIPQKLSQKLGAPKHFCNAKSCDQMTVPCPHVTSHE